jgi:hypothetical protein
MRNKRFLIVRIVSIFALGSFSAIIRGDIAVSAHDFVDKNWSQDRICRPYHAPHNTNPAVTKAPLWNHELTMTSFNQRYFAFSILYRL